MYIPYMYILGMYTCKLPLLLPLLPLLPYQEGEHASNTYYKTYFLGVRDLRELPTSPSGLELTPVAA